MRRVHVWPPLRCPCSVIAQRVRRRSSRPCATADVFGRRRLETYCIRLNEQWCAWAKRHQSWGVRFRLFSACCRRCQLGRLAQCGSGAGLGSPTVTLCVLPHLFWLPSGLPPALVPLHCAAVCPPTILPAASSLATDVTDPVDATGAGGWHVLACPQSLRDPQATGGSSCCRAAF